MKLTAYVCLLIACACATAPVSSAQSTACGRDQSAVADRGAIVYAGPDGTSAAVTKLAADTRVCIGSETAGFGFRRVRLADGREGYVPESSLGL
jgi:hypothetical protein